MAQFPPVAEQMRILMRGVDFGDAQTYANMEKELRERLQESYDSGRPLRVYCGYDPSSPDLHLGHTISMRKLRQFQDLGHDVTFLIGTFTGMVGDPSDKDSARRQQTLNDAMGKARSYADQAFRVLDRDQDRDPLQPRMVERAFLWGRGGAGLQLHRTAVPAHARTSPTGSSVTTPSGCTSSSMLSCRATTP